MFVAGLFSTAVNEEERCIININSALCVFVSCRSLYRRKYKQGECRVFMWNNAVTVYVLAEVLSAVSALGLVLPV